ncbi:MAG: DUF2291 family protein [Eubacteriales bacterium]|nr:DUF2291 family protein [Eubacteriales bacterium]
MKKRAILAAITLSAVCTMTGCGIVKVVPIGQESTYTGEKSFDSSEASSNDWEQVVQDITDKSTALDELVKSDDGISSTGSAVSGTATVVEFNTDTPKYFLLVEMDGVDKEIKIQAGGVYSGTAVRDVQALKGFEDFTNQTEWSQYAKALNKEVDAQVVSALGLDESAAGKKVTFVGAAVQSGDTITITPVSLSLE